MTVHPLPRRGGASLRASVALALAAGLLIACSSQPPAPDWQLNARGAAARAVSAWLSGVSRTPEADWQRAWSEVSRTADPAQAARLALLRCAAESAALVWDGCPAYAPLAVDAAPAEQAYARYLAGSATAADAPRLPEAQRALVAAAGPGAAAALALVADPLSRLVAAGVLLRRGQADAPVVALAVDTASAQGWRRPLLAWLGVQRRLAEAAGDALLLARIDRRLALLGPAAAEPGR